MLIKIIIGVVVILAVAVVMFWLGNSHRKRTAEKEIGSAEDEAKRTRKFGSAATKSRSRSAAFSRRRNPWTKSSINTSAGRKSSIRSWPMWPLPRKKSPA